MKIFCLTFILLFTKIFVINAQEILNINEHRRPFLLDDINSGRLIDIRQNIFNYQHILGLSEEQSEQIKKFEDDMQKNLDTLDKQLQDLQKHLQYLETQDVANIKTINRNINKQSKVIAKQLKLKALYKQKIRAVLNKEQRAEFDAILLQSTIH